ncbi:cytochrome P450, partial [Salmonella sp. s51228]|uniref:cytochrome P450 n=1 Tax=Salmonella sp. s51228 TaxID=3159652 RepID=UPI00397EEBBD
MWSTRRRMLTPAFHFDILKPYVNTFNESAEIAINKWMTQIERGVDTIEVFTEASHLTLDVMLKCACSYSKDQESELDLTTYISAIHTANNMLIKQVYKVIY